MALAPRSPQRVQALSQQTYQTLRSAILSGELSAGTRLVEAQLAKSLQVSRTPVRDALRQLQRETLVEADAIGGLRVAVLTVVDALHLYGCRLALEQFAVAEACRNMTSQQLARLELTVQQAQKAVTQQPHQLTQFQLLYLDYEFHRAIAKGSGNRRLIFLLNQVFDQMTLLRIRTLKHNPRVLEICDEHERIYQAIAERQPELAVQAMQNHLTASQERVVREIQQLEQGLDSTAIDSPATDAQNT